jgi:hypothetical protein
MYAFWFNRCAVINHCITKRGGTMNRVSIAAVLVLAWSAVASAITVDGTLDAEYGAAVAVQMVDTEFGDAFPPNALGGSELDAAYAAFESGRLYLMFTGNHEPNFNKLDVFIDSVAGGENVLSGTPEYDFFNGTIWISQNMGGMVLDAGFEADYHLFSRWGGGNTPGPYEADFVNRQGGTSAVVPGSSAVTDAPVNLVAIGVIPAGDIGPNTSESALTQNLEFAIDNSNGAGVLGGTGPADMNAAAAVLTGMEFSIALADIGNPAPGSSIRIMAVINNGDHNYLSNQFLGSLVPSQGNLGGNGTGGFDGNLDGINLNNFGGDQFFTLVVPAAAGVDGDYNDNGIVDAADYVLWRDTLGMNVTLPNDTTPGSVAQVDYDVWRANFGAGGGNAALADAAVPEPASLALWLVAALVAALFGAPPPRCR